MASPFDLSGLNAAQLKAVCACDGPLLVLAGAGSGKTRVLSYRIAHLLADLGVSPYQILAITFTNKAAAEMRARLGQLLGQGCRGMWVATFHAACVRLLRYDAELLGYTKDFTIYDEDDSRRLAKEVFAELNLDAQGSELAVVRQHISRAKNELVGVRDFGARATNRFDRNIARVYERLQERLLRADAMDFDDLLMNAYRLLAENPGVLAAWQQRFRYLLVDEYQDTNYAQYALCRLLASSHRNLMVVGDDDQSIYSWRGADIRNILEFERDYPEAQVVKLEQNYRSTVRILDAANAIIANNSQRKPKQLFTDGAEGEKISFYLASDERDEGRWIAAEVERLHRSGRPYSDFAVFYRVNAQSRVLEDMLLRAGIPYRIVGGTRFFDRAEIRDVMAYLRLVVNPADDIAAKRVINVPRRGLGKKSIEALEQLALSEGISFMAAIELSLAATDVMGRSQEALANFLRLIKDGRAYRGSLRDIVEMVVEKSGYLDALEADDTDEARSRAENVGEFFGVAQEFDESHPEDDDSDDGGYLGYSAEASAAIAGSGTGRATLAASPAVIASSADADGGASAASQLVRFMEWLSLRSDLDSLVAGQDYLTLMTVHSAKGLEFPAVFVAGMEEGLFPHSNSKETGAGLEEERRLAYVAVTRARELLYLSAAQMRRVFGNLQTNPRSRFIAEIPADAVCCIGLGSAGFDGTGWEKRGDRRGVFGSGSRFETEAGHVFGAGRPPRGATVDAAAAGQARYEKVRDTSFAVGDMVDHKTFGRGRVEATEGDALIIRFDASGETKKLLRGFAPLVKLESD